MLREPRFQGPNFEGKVLGTRLVLRMSVYDHRRRGAYLF